MGARSVEGPPVSAPATRERVGVRRQHVLVLVAAVPVFIQIMRAGSIGDVSIYSRQLVKDFMQVCRLQGWLELAKEIWNDQIFMDRVGYLYRMFLGFCCDDTFYQWLTKVSVSAKNLHFVSHYFENGIFVNIVVKSIVYFC